MSSVTPSDVKWCIVSLCITLIVSLCIKLIYLKVILYMISYNIKNYANYDENIL